MSFNGGKDCTMLLILVLAAKEFFCHTKNIAMHPLRCLYIKSIDSFSEVDDFVDYCSNRFNLNVERYEASMKEGLKIFLDTNPISKAIVIGTRSTDPFGDKMKPFQSTDGEWPRIIRIHPILNWNYEDVWRIIRSLNIPYCKLYDLG
jgi:FAD synthetase